MAPDSLAVGSRVRRLMHDKSRVTPSRVRLGCTNNLKNSTRHYMSVNRLFYLHLLRSLRCTTFNSKHRFSAPAHSGFLGFCKVRAHVIKERTGIELGRGRTDTFSIYLDFIRGRKLIKESIYSAYTQHLLTAKHIVTKILYVNFECWFLAVSCNL